MKKLLTLICLLCLTAGATAQSRDQKEKQDPAQQQNRNAGEEAAEAAPAPPEAPEPLQSGEPIEPQVTIIREDDATIEEYRVNGILYMVKIMPAGGKPYYLVDRDGDGTMETRRGGLQDPPVPRWVLFSW